MSVDVSGHVPLPVGGRLADAPRRRLRVAERVLRSLELAADRHVYREYYNPLSGRGLGARGFGFATLLIDLLAQCGVGSAESSGEQRIMQP